MNRPPQPTCGTPIVGAFARATSTAGLAGRSEETRRSDSHVHRVPVVRGRFPAAGSKLGGCGRRGRRHRRAVYVEGVRTPIKHDPDPLYAEFEVHRTMIRDQVRTEAFRRAIDSVVSPGDIVLDVGAGSGILSLFAARAGAARVYAVEQTSIAVLAQQLAAANGVAEIVQVIQGDILDVEPPERVDVLVSEWF